MLACCQTDARDLFNGLILFILIIINVMTSFHSQLDAISTWHFHIHTNNIHVPT